MVDNSVGAGEVAEIGLRKAEVMIFGWLILTSLYIVGMGWLALTLYNKLAAWTQRRAARLQSALNCESAGSTGRDCPVIDPYLASVGPR